MSDIYIPAAIRIRGEHPGFPLSGEYPDFEFTCHRKDVTTTYSIHDELVVNVTPVMLLTAQGHGQTFVACGDDGREVYEEMKRQLKKFG